MSDKPNLYKWCAGFGRMGELSGVVLLSSADIDEAHGQRVGFGEVLGKHSDVYYTIDRAHFTLLTDDQAWIARGVDMGIIPIGCNPCEYVEKECPECGDVSPVNEWSPTTDTCCKWNPT